MNRLPSILMFTACLLLTACSSTAMQTASDTAESPHAAAARPQAAHAVQSDRIVIQDERGSAILQKVAFRSGVSSATVEKLARRFGCAGSTGAGLITDKGPLEVYRLRCDNGTTFMAQCELRQCRPMR
jgi:ABC-type uncharacterized transport system auxiliary subunit